MYLSESEVGIKIKLLTKTAKLPKYKTDGAVGLDLYADIEDIMIIGNMESIIIPTGISIELPKGVEAQIRSRSGKAVKNNLFVLNSPGTIDQDYRGEIKVILFNLSKKNQFIRRHESVAQLVVSPVIKVDWILTNELSDTKRGLKGLGSTDG